jgi:hypothetical protein
VLWEGIGGGGIELESVLKEGSEDPGRDKLLELAWPTLGFDFHPSRLTVNTSSESADTGCVVAGIFVLL